MKKKLNGSDKMEEAYSYILNEINIKPNDNLIVACSGGPDSMSLLSLFVKLKKDIDVNVICAHVNHNVRSESAEEYEFVKKYSLDNNIIFEGMVIDNYSDDNFHNEARTKRYTFFGKLVKKYNAKYLFTAHHGDDLMETILMRIVRGSTLKGYSGFSRIADMEDYLVVRPLIKITKEEIEKYNKENNIKYATDLSNFKEVYTRNRYRKNILPLLKNEDKEVHKKFYKFSKMLQEFNEYFDIEIKEKITKIYKNKELDIELFLKEKQIIQKKIIYYILELIYDDDLLLITDRHAELTFDLINSKKANISIHLPNDIVVTKSYKKVTFFKNIEKETSYEIEISQYVKLPNGKVIEKIKNSKLNNNNICRLDSNQIKLPLYVRNRKNGDKMHIKGMEGRKKINDIFINEKIELNKRDTWPIVLDSDNNIVWLPGLKKSNFDKTNEDKYDIILKYH
ncbi:MAG: tRNA lysidine(34) synthetase TilS [Bacilli bacterium]|nr:tRNA lysidine(34) synthetase TilS [Bacilli bacterium]